MSFTIKQLEELQRKNPQLFRALVEKYELAGKGDEEPGYMRDLHYEQKRFVLDKSPRKCALAGRRGGKSHGIGVWLLDGAKDYPNEESVYIGLSRSTARKILWKAMQGINRRYSLGLKFGEKDNQLIITTPNNHTIWLAGCKDSAEIEKFRGPYYRRVCIDEAASFGPYLRDLIWDVLDPALLDLGGELAMTGTPGAIPSGPFYECTTGDGGELWPTYHWTCLQNPAIQMKDPDGRKWSEERVLEELALGAQPGYINPRSKAELEARIERSKWQRDPKTGECINPTFQREWMAKWIKDEGALVYPFTTQNLFHKLPDTEGYRPWRYAIGIDVGVVDSTAFVVGAYRHGVPGIWIVEAYKREGLSPSSVAAHIGRLRMKYDTSDVVMDVGGLGKGYQIEMLERYGEYAAPAKKTQKRGFIETVRGELQSGMLKIHPHDAGCLLDEWQRLVWNEDRSKPDDRFEDHASDACLYLVRHILPGNRSDVERPEVPHEEKVRAQAKAEKEAAMKRVRERLRLSSRRQDYLREIAEGKRF